MGSPRRAIDHPGGGGRSPMCHQVLLILTIFSRPYSSSDRDIKAVIKSTAAALVDATQAAVLVLYYCVLWESC